MNVSQSGLVRVEAGTIEDDITRDHRPIKVYYLDSRTHLKLNYFTLQY